MLSCGRFRLTHPCTLLLLLCIGLIVLQVVYLDGLKSKNGELGLWYAISTCFNPDSSFTVAGTVYDVFTLRPVVVGEPMGSACPVVPPAGPPASPIDIVLEESDGYRAGGSYAPIILLPTSSYALIEFVRAACWSSDIACGEL